LRKKEEVKPSSAVMVGVKRQGADMEVEEPMKSKKAKETDVIME
jgi:hypothetical protein